MRGSVDKCAASKINTTKKWLDMRSQLCSQVYDPVKIREEGRLGYDRTERGDVKVMFLK